jgi:gamma-butyrobetaine dioxygenase
MLVSAVATGAGLTLGWQGGGESFLPWSWLRDACPCEDCRGEGGRQRTLDVRTNAFPVGARRLDWSRDSVRLAWPGHASTWSADALQMATVPTTAGVADNNPRQGVWSDVQSSDVALERMLGAVVDRGAALVTGVPPGCWPIRSAGRRSTWRQATP